MKFSYKRNVAYSITSTFVSIGAPLLLIPMILSTYGVNNYGVLSTILATGYLVYIIFEMGLNQGIQKHILQDILSIKQAVLLLFVYRFSVFFVLLIVFLMFFELKEYILEFILSVVLLASVEPIVLSIDRHKEILMVNIASKLILFFFVICLTSFQMKFDFIIYSYIFSNLIVTVGMLLTLLPLIINDQKSTKKTSLNKSKFFSIFIDCLKFHISRVMVSSYQQSSVFFVSIFVSEYSTGVYALCSQIYKMSQSIIGAVSKVVFTSSMKDKNTVVLFLLLKIILAGYVVGMITFFLFDEQIVKLIDLSALQHMIVFKIMLFSVLFVILSSFFGYPYLTPINKEGYSHVGLVISSITYFAAFYIFWLVDEMTILSFSIMILISDAIGASYRCYYAYKFRGSYNELN